MLNNKLTSLSQLEYILLPIHNLELTFRSPQPHITRVKPSLAIDRLFCLFFVFVIPLEYRRSAYADFSATLAGFAVVGCIYIIIIELKRSEKYTRMFTSLANAHLCS